MHVLDSTDSAAGLYVAGPPKTLIGRHYLNAVGREILGVLTAAGVTPRASGTADAVASYTGQLVEALRIAAQTHAAVQAATVTLHATLETNLAPASNITDIVLAASVAHNNVVNLPDSATYVGRVITIRNQVTHSGQVFIKDRRGFINVMHFSQVSAFICFTGNGGTNYDWAPLDGEYSGIAALSYSLSAPASSIGPFNVYYRRKGPHTSLQLPYCEAEFEAGNLITVTLPTYLLGAPLSRILLPATTDGDATQTIVHGNFEGDGNLTIYGLVNGSSWFYGGWLHYVAKNSQMTP